MPILFRNLKQSTTVASHDVDLKPLRPQLAEQFRTAVAKLTHECLSDKASAIVPKNVPRELIDRIEIPSGDEPLKLVAKPAAMLALAAGGNVGCGGSLPAIATHFAVPLSLYVVAA